MCPVDADSRMEKGKVYLRGLWQTILSMTPISKIMWELWKELEGGKFGTNLHLCVYWYIFERRKNLKYVLCSLFLHI
jgi:hypothetical protein